MEKTKALTLEKMVLAPGIEPVPTDYKSVALPTELRQQDEVEIIRDLYL